MLTHDLLVVEHLTTAFATGQGQVRAVDDATFVVGQGETVGLVGESGSGKSVTALSILRLVQAPGRIVAGRVVFEGRDLLTLPEPEMRAIRGARIAIIFQEPMAALNPVFAVGDQVAEALVAHGRTREDARREAERLLEVVRLPDPRRVARAYAHELSGGMRQRVLIAAAIACRPALVIADEPTTALDVSIQADILDLLREMKQEYQLSLLLITHDLRVVAHMADRVLVMHRGRLIEQASARSILATPQHPYTKLLVDAARLSAGSRGLPVERPATERRPLVEVGGLIKEFPVRRQGWHKPALVRAVDDVSFTIEEGETFGLVGESGSGKTTTGRCLLGLVTPRAGRVRFRGEDVLAASPGRMRELRRDMQIVFQDPFSSLNPRMRAGAIVEEPLVIHRLGDRKARRARVDELFQLVGLDAEMVRRYPHQFSGGQRQRLVIARALALGPSFLVADEPVSALDMSVQAQIIALLMDLQQRLSLTCLLIAHDLRLVERVCTRMAVMHRGRIVEMGRTDAILAAPSHPHTRELVARARALASA